MIQGEGVQCGPVSMFNSQGQTLSLAWLFWICGLCDGYMGEGKVTVDDVLIIWEYPNLFHQDFPGMPPERQVESRVDLVLGATPIDKAHY